MSAVKINVRANPYYTGTKALDGNTYRLTIRWNTNTQKWYMDIKGITNTIERDGIALLPGKDLLYQFGYSELGELWVIDNSGAGENPNFDDMGGRFTLEYTPLNS